VLEKAGDFHSTFIYSCQSSTAKILNCIPVNILGSLKKFHSSQLLPEARNIFLEF